MIRLVAPQFLVADETVRALVVRRYRYRVIADHGRPAEVRSDDDGLHRLEAERLVFLRLGNDDALERARAARALHFLAQLDFSLHDRSIRRSWRLHINGIPAIRGDLYMPDPIDRAVPNMRHPPARPLDLHGRRQGHFFSCQWIGEPARQRLARSAARRCPISKVAIHFRALLSPKGSEGDRQFRRQGARHRPLLEEGDGLRARRAQHANVQAEIKMIPARPGSRISRSDCPPAGTARTRDDLYAWMPDSSFNELR